MKELPKAYEPKNYEDNIYRTWEKSGLFNPDNLEGEPYSIMMPPPNVTGVLHLGHALENSLMDTQARYQRMLGKKVLLIPGTDHAAVATQAKVEKLLVEKGIQNPREYFGREGLVNEIREFAEDSKQTILGQIKKMGTSADWSRLRYTFDEDRNKAVNEMFTQMYNDGIIYRGTRLINWSVGAQTVLSDDEQEWEERKEPFYYIRCGKFVIGTVRSETKCASSPLIVHPEGLYVELQFTNTLGKSEELIVSKQLFENKEEFERIFNLLDVDGEFTVVKEYTGKELEGQEFDAETYGGMRHFKVLADEVIDMDKGAGAMTISTHHSADDYDLATRYDLQETFFDKIGFDGKMLAIAGPLEGMDREQARTESAKIMKEKGLLIGIDEDYSHRTPLCYRTKTVIEPMVSRQWFVDVNKKFKIKKSKLKNIKEGQEVSLKELMQTVVRFQEVKITPSHFEKTYFHWIDNLQNWCISRQICWGHRIPVWYKGEEIYVGISAPEGDDWVQDEDSLDTWFSSGLWTFSTLGWPEKTIDLEQFHTTNWMQMGYEILFFWMARMILMSTYALGEIPFNDVYIHGMLRDKHGKKFSKSSGNGIDPLEVIEEYGTDALRFSLLAGISPGNDSKFYTEKVEGSQHMVNKLWNVSRFMLMNIDEPQIDAARPEPKTAVEQWILWKLDETCTKVNELFAQYQFSQVGEVLREFMISELADWYLEMAKVEDSHPELLNYVLNSLLKLWHPYLPFVTESIWGELYGTDRPLMGESYPQAKKSEAQAEVTFVDTTLREVITSLRSLRAEWGIAPGKKLSASLVCSGPEQAALDSAANIIQQLARIESLTIAKEVKKTSTMMSAVVGNIEVLLDTAGAIDIDAEKARLQKEIDNVAPYVVSQEKKLAGPFAQNAPEAVVNQEKQKLAEAQTKLTALQEQLARL